MKTKIFTSLFLSLLIFFSAFSQSQISHNSILLKSDSLAGKWFKKHEIAFGLTPNIHFEGISILGKRGDIINSYRVDYKHNKQRYAFRSSINYYSVDYTNENNKYARLWPWYMEIEENHGHWVKYREGEIKIPRLKTISSRIGIEYRYRFWNRFCLSAGSDIGYSWADTYYFNEYFEKTAFNNSGLTIYDTVAKETNAIEHGIVLSPFFGLRVEVIKNLALGFESTFDFMQNM